MAFIGFLRNEQTRQTPGRRPGAKRSHLADDGECHQTSLDHLACASNRSRPSIRNTRLQSWLSVSYREFGNLAYFGAASLVSLRSLGECGVRRIAEDPYLRMA